MVVIGVEDKGDRSKTGRGIGRIRLQCVPDASAQSLCGFVQSHITLGSCVRTDGWTGYTPLREKGYQHLIVGARELTIAHRIASLMQRRLLGTYQGAVKAHHLGYYLDEFTFRFNRRSSASKGNCSIVWFSRQWKPLLFPAAGSSLPVNMMTRERCTFEPPQYVVVSGVKCIAHKGENAWFVGRSFRGFKRVDI